MLLEADAILVEGRHLPRRRRRLALPQVPLCCCLCSSLRDQACITRQVEVGRCGLLEVYRPVATSPSVSHVKLLKPGM